MDPNMKQWRKSGKHLPKFMRDFHDQKDVFKMIHRVTEIKTDRYRNEITWVDGSIYVIDTFLWCMARFGYTLQKTRKKVDFESIEEMIKYCNDERLIKLGDILNNQQETK